MEHHLRHVDYPVILQNGEVQATLRLPGSMSATDYAILKQAIENCIALYGIAHGFIDMPVQDGLTPTHPKEEG